MPEQVKELLTEHFMLLFAFFGLILLLAAVFNWRWFVTPPTRFDAPFMKDGLIPYRFKVGVVGALLILLGLYTWFYR